MLAAGGTGGHLFPAQALAEELVSRGFRIHLLTDERVRDYGKNFPAEATHIIPSATLSLSQPLKVPGRALTLLKGYGAAKHVIRTEKAVAIAGFGGYPSLPPLMAATRVGIPSLVHEQNSVLGRANRILAGRVSVVATSFADVRGLPASARHVFTGNPVRGLVTAQAGTAYPALSADGPIRLLVFGGSQGARFFADMMPPTLAALPEQLRKRLVVTQQCREEDMQRTTEAYGKAGIAATLNPFFMDMPSRMAASHLVVSRSGASTIAELGVLGRPAVMVPLPHAIDNDQLRNAESFAAAGGGWLQRQAELAPATFAAFLAGLLGKPETLKEAAAAALRQGKPQAAQSLADLVQSLLPT